MTKFGYDTIPFQGDELIKGKHPSNRLLGMETEMFIIVLGSSVATLELLHVV